MKRTIKAIAFQTFRPDILDDDKIPVQDYIDTVTNEDVSTIRFLNSSTESQPSTVHVIKKKEPVSLCPFFNFIPY